MNEARIKELEKEIAALTRAGHTATGEERRVLGVYKGKLSQQIDTARRED